MIRTALILAAIATLTLPMAATGSSKPVIREAAVRTKLCAKPQVLKTAAIPATATPEQTQAWVNGVELRGWNEAPMIAGLGGYGVIVQVSLTHKTGPATVRLANALGHCVKVWVLLTWR